MVWKAADLRTCSVYLRTSEVRVLSQDCKRASHLLLTGHLQHNGSNVTDQCPGDRDDFDCMTMDDIVDIALGQKCKCTLSSIPRGSV
jgi:hypothetical protein